MYIYTYRQKREKVNVAKMLMTGESKGWPYRYSLYYSYNFFVGLKFFKIKIREKKLKTTNSFWRRG